MKRPMIVLVFLVPAVALAADDPIKAELDKARSAYARGVDAATTKLATAMEARLKEVAGKGDLGGAKEVKSQKDLFEKDGTLPRSPLLTRARADYESEVRAAREQLHKALEKAKGDYTKALKLGEAEAVADELKELDAPHPKGAGGAAGPGKAPVVVSTWALQVGNGKDSFRSTVKLYSNGKIDNPAGRATWAFAKGIATMRWPDPKAPSGVWIAVCNMAADGQSFQGKNNNGTPIYGRRLGSGDIDAGKKK